MASELTVPANLPPSYRREYEAHLAHALAVYDAVTQVRTKTKAKRRQITRDAVKELEQISADISSSSISPEWKATLREQVLAAFSRHEELLAQADHAADFHLQHVVQQPVRVQPSAFGELADEIDQALGSISDALFKPFKR